MARIYWTDRARQQLESLPDADQDAISALLARVRQWPEMYQEVTAPARRRGYRRFAVRRRWIVFYRVNKGADPEEDQVYIADIVPARSDY